MADEYPFFKFYVRDWLSDLHVRSLSAEERGIYIDLLAFDWNEDGIPDPDAESGVRIAYLLGVDAGSMRDAWSALRTHFVQHPEKEGWVTNRRLLKERKEIGREARKRSERARKAANARWGNEPATEDDADSMPDACPARSREKSEVRDRGQNTDTETDNRLPPQLRATAGSETSVDQQLRELAVLGNGPEPVPEGERGRVVQLLVGIWHDLQTMDPAEGSASKQGAAAKRLAARTSPRRLALALYGMSQMWEHSEQGRPWDLFDLERKLDNALETAWRSRPTTESEFEAEKADLASEL